MTTNICNDCGEHMENCKCDETEGYDYEAKTELPELMGTTTGQSHRWDDYYEEKDGLEFTRIVYDMEEHKKGQSILSNNIGYVDETQLNQEGAGITCPECNTTCSVHITEILRDEIIITCPFCQTENEITAFKITKTKPKMKKNIKRGK